MIWFCLKKGSSTYSSIKFVCFVSDEKFTANVWEIVMKCIVTVLKLPNKTFLLRFSLNDNDHHGKYDLTTLDNFVLVALNNEYLR